MQQFSGTRTEALLPSQPGSRGTALGLRAETNAPQSQHLTIPALPAAPHTAAGGSWVPAGEGLRAD